MLRYTIKRLIQGVITVWFIATATFLAMHSIPGDPLTSDKAVSEEIRKNLEAKYGLDKPLGEQYVIYLSNMLQGDFGISFSQENRSVNDIIREHFPVSATLGILAIAFAGLGGILFGALTALYRTEQIRSHVRRALDNGVTKDEIGEIITHMAFYSGWPTAVNAAQVAKEVYAERKI